MIGVVDQSQFAVRETAPAVIIGAILMLAIGWWLASGRAGAGLRPLAVPLAVATGVAFAARPLDASDTSVGIMLGGFLVALAMVPLAIGLMERIEDEADRRLVGVVTAAMTGGALVLAVAAGFTEYDRLSFARWLIVGAIPIVPGIAAARPVRSVGLDGATASTGRLLESAEYAVAGVTPLVALNTGNSLENLLFPLSVFWLLVFVAGRFTVRPLARLVSRTAFQRDLVVAATEAERARVAADIHDDALQELTILVHRLDAAGDTEGAEIARTVSDRLRAICGDLRLPILDDLGVGPALDWLVLRIERLAGGEVRLERTRRHAPAGRRRARVLPGRPGGAVERGQARPAADRRALQRLDRRRVAVHRRCRARDRAAGRPNRPRRPATSACSTCSSGPRRSARSWTSGAGRPAGRT